MKGRTALVAALVSGGLAVAIVTLDLQFGLEVELQVMEDGEWVAVSTSHEPYPDREFGHTCVDRELRIVVDNNRFLPTSVPVRAGYYSLQGEYIRVVSDTWTISAGEQKAFAFTVPDSAFVPRESPDGPHPKPAGGYTVSVDGVVDNQHYVSACVREVPA